MKKIILKLCFLAALVIGASQVDAQRFYVNIRPPAPPVVARPVVPHPGYVWVDGEYAWRGGRYEYVPGYWHEPRRGYVWHRGYWARGPRGHYWIAGRWGR